MTCQQQAVKQPGYLLFIMIMINIKGHAPSCGAAVQHACCNSVSKDETAVSCETCTYVPVTTEHAMKFSDHEHLVGSMQEARQHRSV